MKKLLYGHVPTIGCVSLILTSPAWSQEAADDSVLAEVVVSAQKRIENVQDVPTSINVVNQQELQKFGGSQLSDIARMVPTLQPPTGLNTRAPAIRGISSFASSQGVPTAVGIIIDDVPQSNWSTLGNELTDVERVEVLEGPQFTLSGRNAAGGLINIVTRAPSNEWTGTLSADLTEDNERSFRGFISGPIGDGSAFSISAFSHQFRGNVENKTSQTWQNAYDNQGIRAKARFSLTDALKLTLTAYYQTQNVTQQSPAIGGGVLIYASPAARWAFDPQGRTPAALTGQNIGSDNDTTFSPRNTTLDIKDRGGVVRFDYDFASATLSSISSLYRSRQPSRIDFIPLDLSTTLVPVIAPGFDGYANQFSGVNEFTQEVRLVSTGSGALQYVLGGIYSNTENLFDYRRVIFPFDSDRETRTKSAALYGRGTWEFVQHNFIQLGLRAQQDKQSYEWQFNAIPGAQPAGTVVGDNDYTFGAGDVSFRHEFSDDVMAYASYTQGETGRAYDVEDNVTALGTANRPGGSFGALSPLPSEKVKSEEIGIKSSWFEHRVTANVSVFYADYKNYQLQSVVLDPANPAAAPTLKLLSIGAVNTKGVEVSSDARLGGGWDLGFSGAYIDAKLTKFPNAGCYALQTAAQGCINGVQPSLAGARMPNSPKFKGNLTLDKRFNTAGLPFDPELGLAYRYQTQVNFDVLQNPFARMGGFGITNLRVGVRSHDDTWNVHAYVNNLFDKRYYGFAGQSAIWTVAPVISAQIPRDSSRYFGVSIGGRF